MIIIYVRSNSLKFLIVEEAPSAESPPKDEPKPVEHFTETTSQEIEDNVQNEILCIPSVRRIAKENKVIIV